MGNYSSHQTFPPFSWIHLHVMLCVLVDDDHSHGIIIFFKLSSSHLKWKGRKRKREKYFHQVKRGSLQERKNKREEDQTSWRVYCLSRQGSPFLFPSSSSSHPPSTVFLPFVLSDCIFSSPTFHNSIEVPVSFSSLTQHTYTDDCWESRRKTERRRLSSWSILQWRVTGGCQWM